MYPTRTTATRTDSKTFTRYSGELAATCCTIWLKSITWMRPFLPNKARFPMTSIDLADPIQFLESILFEGLGYEDRKSTRLNSSHANISYAVFCLKKKKNQIQTS